LPAATASFLIVQELRRRTEADSLAELYPDEGPMRRELYAKHVKMLAAGKAHQERVCLGGNRIGKTLSIGGFETALHATGLYPAWWAGYVCPNKALTIWAAGTKSAKVRDVNQKFLLGTLHQRRGYTEAVGGLIPASRIGRLTRRSGVADAIDQVVVKHVSGRENLITFKSYEEGREAFEAEGVDFIWLDEEPTKPIYEECKMRLLTTNGRILSTFTPVDGMTETVLMLLKDSGLI
jgi:phage terminase large subunit-like protein